MGKGPSIYLTIKVNYILNQPRQVLNTGINTPGNRIHND
jgi:hypothetical protein